MGRHLVVDPFLEGRHPSDDRPPDGTLPGFLPTPRWDVTRVLTESWMGSRLGVDPLLDGRHPRVDDSWMGCNPGVDRLLDGTSPGC